VFAAVLPIDADARALAEAARLKVAQTPVVVEGVPLSLTVSAGVATVPARACATPADVEAVVDDRVYAAKCAGRNRTV
jgi:GGDEF domain-containing protein